MSDTPRTDALDEGLHVTSDGYMGDIAERAVQFLALCRELERELAHERQFTAAWRRAYDGLVTAGNVVCDRAERQEDGLADVTTRVREIHEVLKRGKATQDHGLTGNLACILDTVCKKYDPK